ncbi:triosephosphate isomerase [Micromonospora rhizosphaerae]|uniref:Triosephosphate isomerase n=1 Tax=Micromonospora rhizosphaerae TaxID=568872 RepID=A0A1C6SRP1_9ACTN|nr:triose-phosphate isomerase [Micromonospora rhizosphaerae]SCL32158.1 triosephosphate isomerase [Micromonospora rhizosphaerae]
MVLWVGTSWKMNKTRAEAVSFATRLRDAAAAGGWPGVQPFVVPSATAISVVRDALGPDSPVVVGAQNAHWEDAGAWTGEVSVPQVADAGATLVEIGHSERREHFGETDRTVNRKVRATLRHGLTALVCVGESAEVRTAGGARQHVLSQVAAALDRVPAGSGVLLAYEPVWAIGDRGREPTVDEVAEITEALDAEYSGVASGLLYGGSVTTANARDLLHTRGVTGLFVGRSAWNVDGYLHLLRIATDVAQEAGRVFATKVPR